MCDPFFFFILIIIVWVMEIIHTIIDVNNACKFSNYLHQIRVFCVRICGSAIKPSYIIY